MTKCGDNLDTLFTLVYFRAKITTMQSLFFTSILLPNEIINSRYSWTAAEIDLLTKLLAVRKSLKAPAAAMELPAQLFDPENAGGAKRERLRATFRSLQSKPLEFWNDQRKCYTITNVLASAEIPAGSQRLRVTFSEPMQTLLTAAAVNYTTLQAATLLSLSGAHSKRLYWQLCKWASTGVVYTTPDQLRDWLQLGEKYAKVGDLEKRVIYPALMELNAKSEFKIELEKSRAAAAQMRGNTYTFTFKLKAEHAQLSSENKQAERLRRYGLAPWQIENVLTAIDPELLRLTLYNFSLISEKVTNKGAYLAATFRNLGAPMDKAIPRQLSLSLRHDNTGTRPAAATD